jgi:hypothetical protein
MMVRFREDDASGAPVRYATGMVNQQLLLQNEYLLAENRILRAHLSSRPLLTDPERSTLAVIGKRLGRRGLQTVQRLPSQTQSWPGFASWSLRSSMALGTPSLRVDRPLDVRPLNSSSAWLVRIAGGDTIASPAHWTIWVIVSPIKPCIAPGSVFVL